MKTKHKAASRYSFISNASCETRSDKEQSCGRWKDLSKNNSEGKMSKVHLYANEQGGGRLKGRCVDLSLVLL